MDAETETEKFLTKRATEDAGDDEEEFSYFNLLDKPRVLPEPVNLTFQHLKDVGYDLGLIDLCWPEEIKPIFENRTDFPIKYISHTEKERALLLYTKNFRKKFIRKYPNRKPLFLVRDNECGVLKMVCTTVKPTALPYPVFEMWDTCADFIGDHIKFETLESKPLLLPNHLYSPHTTLLRQSGTSFEIATVLCSILIGVGYDAYVVSGYADRDIALRIMVRVDCPFPPFKEEEEKPPEKPKIEKYAIKPPNDYKSKFLMMMEQRERDKLFKQDLQAAERERLRLLEEEKPPFDELDGQRIHAWVLIKAGSKGIKEHFFIESTTGRPYSLNTTKYFGIESVWNHQNYWVNLQDCSKGLDTIDYTLTNNEKWIHLLAGEPFELRIQKEKDLGDDDTSRDMFVEKHLDMPQPWPLRLYVSHARLQGRFPDGGCRTTNYKRVLVEQFAPFASPDGLTKRLTRFRDFACTDPFLIEEEYEHRRDKFCRSIYDYSTDILKNYYSTGRDDAIIKHVFTKGCYAVEAHRVLFFNHSNRADYLQKMEVEEDKIIEHFKDRTDKLIYRQINYLKEEEEKKAKQGYKRFILTMLQKYERNEDKPSHEDIAIREFALVDREIRLKYHYGPNNITASTRVFIKPSVTEWGEDLEFNSDLTYGYQAEVGVKLPRQVELFKMFHYHLKEEHTCLISFRQIEKYLADFLTSRVKELNDPQLDVPIFNREQNVQYREQMLEKEEKKKIFKQKECFEAVDYLAPYIVKYRRPLTFQQARTAKNECLKEYKEMMVGRANNLYKQYEDLDAKLRSMKSYYATERSRLSENEETEYYREVTQLVDTMKAIQIRTDRHKQLASIKIKQVESYLNSHPLLQILWRRSKK